MTRSARSSARASAEKELERAREEAAEIRDKAENDAGEILRKSEALVEGAALMRREVEEESRVLKNELKELRADLERRERGGWRSGSGGSTRKGGCTPSGSGGWPRARPSWPIGGPSSRRLGEQRREVLERVAGLTADQAKGELVKEIENQAKREAALIVREIESDARKEGEKRACKIVTLAVQRVATEQTAESVVSVLHLPGDEMKGRIIGREGRNIRAFESTTGVNLIIDDTPEAVLLSCFDPVRRETARLTLEKLVLDGRIHPQRIEEAYERSRAEVRDLRVRAGEDALVELGITEMHPELITLLGRLRYRTSYGQNVLKHLIESAHIAGIMASELRLDRDLVKRCALLHDIGKALTHEVEGGPRPHRRRDRPSLRRARGRRPRHRGPPQRGRGAYRRSGSPPRPPTRSAAAGPGRGGRASRPT